MKITINSMRLEAWQKNRLQMFADLLPDRLTDTDIKSICFGKQDIRGALSITIFDDRGCVPIQRHFENKTALMGYVDGWLAAYNTDQKWL